MASVSFCAVTLARNGRTLLAGANLSIEPGELVVLTGPRGAGKSLVLATAAGVTAPAAGEVLIAGRALAQLQSSARPYVRRNIGYLPADPPFVREESALENVMLALGVRGLAPAEAELLARRTLAEIGAESLAETPIVDLSVGERRLVAVARALGGPPPIVILDEPSAGLDEADRSRMAEAIAAAAHAGAAALVASNDGALVAALRGAGARQLTLEGGALHGDKARVRLLEGGRSDEPERGVVLAFPARPAREVS
jgi:ABC-type multidrug transport system ATPase subunit